ncbi:MAG: S8 family serine peptidase [Bdellovibrionales bacterium]|nr:S8 family serine peptidase [Bdellovibrionales bacterium]
MKIKLLTLIVIAGLAPKVLGEAPKSYLVKVTPAAVAGLSELSQGSAKRVAEDVFEITLTEESARALSQDHRIIHIEPNLPIRLYAEPNDLNTNLWGLKNARKFDVNATQAWDLTTGSKDVVVAVVDTGVDINHPDLKNNLWINQLEARGTTGVDDDKNGLVDDIHGYNFPANTGDPKDHHGHGTHVAGTIGAVGNNGKGVVGVNWSVSLMAVNIFPRNSDAQTSDAIRGIDYAVKNGAKVINASWGQAGSETEPGELKLLSEAIERAHQAGVVFVAAAGNDSADMDRVSFIPSGLKIDNIIAVGSMNSKGGLSGFSNYGAQSVHVVAPGSDIYSTVPGGGYGYKSGTSMAAPHVTGVVALMFASNPTRSPKEIREAMIRSCVTHSSLNRRSVCGGYVDAAKAIKEVK